MLWDASNTRFTVFSLTWTGLGPMIYPTRCKYMNYYTTDEEDTICLTSSIVNFVFLWIEFFIWKKQHNDTKLHVHKVTKWQITQNTLINKFRSDFPSRIQTVTTFLCKTWITITNTIFCVFGHEQKYYRKNLITISPTPYLLLSVQSTPL
jgi:hypothetical protein